MTSDMRQARIEAAMDQLFRSEGGNVQLAAVGYYTARSRMDAVLQVADAIERERVSEAFHEFQVASIKYGIEQGRHGLESDEARAARVVFEQARDALLTAAPAERGDETGVKP